MSRPLLRHLIPAGWQVLPWVEKNLLAVAHLLKEDTAEAALLEECAGRLHDLWLEFDGRVPDVRANVSGRLAAFRLHDAQLKVVPVAHRLGAFVCKECGA